MVQLGSCEFVLVVLFAAGMCSAFCPPNCLCTDEQPAVDCDNANLSSFPILLNPRIRSLTLSNNRISTLTLDELSFYSELEYLDLSFNKILSVDRGAFFRLQKLKMLRLNGNMLASLSIETFAGLSDLRVLDLSVNTLSRLAASIFSDLPRLESLNLSKNSINYISSGALTNLQHLKDFHLRHNDLSAVPKLALQSTTSLKILDMSFNRIETLAEESFSKLTHLESLNLAGNGLQLIDDEAFANLQNLRQLHLETNQLFRVPTMSFRHLSELNSLTIGENLFAELPTSAFEGLSRLKQLVVTRCPHLTSTAMNAFSGLFDLETLILAENRKLSNMHAMSFEQDADLRANLRRVYFFNNDLSTLHPTLLPYEQLVELDLRRNPWRCDCELSFLVDVLRRVYDNDESRAGAAVCHAPDAFKARPLVTLAPEEFQCHAVSDTPWLVSVASMICALFALTAILLLILRFRRRLYPKTVCELCSCTTSASPTPTKKSRDSPTISATTGRRNFYERQHYVTVPYGGFCSNLKKQFPYGDDYETPIEHQAFLAASSDYYSSGGSYLSPCTQNSTLTREGSFRVIQHYPIPITEL